MVFSMDGAKLYLSVLHPAPASSGVMVVDTATWKIKKEIQGIGPDMQTLAVTYDGKYVIGVFSGFQRLASGIAFIDAQRTSSWVSGQAMVVTTTASSFRPSLSTSSIPAHARSRK
jgi:hypothetical protein